MFRRTFLLGSAGYAFAAEVGGGMQFHTDPDKWDKPFVYPIRTASGKVLSRGFPLLKVEGEQTDHAWHRGVWWGHGIVNGEDFWREQGRDKTSRLVLDRPVKRGRAAFAMMTPAGKRLGTNIQQYVSNDRGGLRFLDATIVVKADQGIALTFGDTDDGGFGFRLSDSFREDRGARLSNSEGLETTKKIWGKAARWVHYEEAQGAGVAVFDHPSNLRHPTKWHARGYSLCAANPFAAHSFDKKDPDGSYTLPAGRELKLRYRVVMHDVSLRVAEVEGLYRQWR